MAPSLQRRRLEFLDGLRGVAILGVFLFHALTYAFRPDVLTLEHIRTGNLPLSGWLLLPVSWGWAGVPLFFAISGFCIHTAHLRSRDHSWKKFYIRRAFRILPPFWVVLGAFAFLWPFGRMAVAGRGTDLLTHLTLTHNFRPETYFSINASFWSIAVEAQLYLLYPILAWLTRKTGWQRALLLATAGEVALGLWKPALPWAFTASPFAYWGSWAMGAWLADTWHRDKPPFCHKWPLWPAVAIAVALQFVPVLTNASFLAWAFVAALVIGRFVDGTWKTPRGWYWRHLSWVGVLSYSLYLLHQPFLKLGSKLVQRHWGGGEPDQLILFCTSLLAYGPLLALAWLYFRVVETRCIALGRRVTGGA